MPKATEDLFTSIKQRRSDNINAAKIKRSMVQLNADEVKQAAKMAADNAQQRTLDAIHQRYPNIITKEVYEQAIIESQQRALLTDNMLEENARPTSSTSSMFKSFFSGSALSTTAGLKIYDKDDKAAMGRDQAQINPGEYIKALLRSEERFAGDVEFKRIPYQAPKEPGVTKNEAYTAGVFSSTIVRMFFGFNSQRPGMIPAVLTSARIPKVL